MSISRTNLFTNPSYETNTTGVSAPAWVTLTVNSFSSTVASGTKALGVGIGAGATAFTYVYQNIPITAGQWVAFSLYARRSSGSSYMRQRIQWRDASSAILSNTWGPVWLGSTSTGGGDRHMFSGQAPTGAVSVDLMLYFFDDAAGTVAPVNPSIYSTDAWLACTGSTVAVAENAANGKYFDGSFAATSNKTFAWTGPENASSSTETTILPTTTAQAMVDAPCPRVGVTVDGLGTGTSTYNLWRTADGTRKIVRGARNRSTVDSDYVIDYEAPLGRPISYDIEVVSGTNYLAATFLDTVTITSATWWIQDPLVPSSAIPLAVSSQDTSIPCLTAAAVKSLEYAADVTIIPILGSSEPVALMGSRQIAGGVDFSMFTRAAEATTTLRNLIQQTTLLLVRTNGVRNDGVPALAYFVSAKPAEHPVTVAFGGTLTNWQLQGDLVAAPSLNVLVPIWTYGDVQALWTTYQQAQTTLAGKTYLDVLKSPTGV